LVVVGFGALGLLPGASSAQEGFDAAGKWASAEEVTDQSDGELGRTWQIRDVQWVDRRTLSGRVALVGVKFLSVGRFEARIVDSKVVSGVLFDRDGKEVGEFEAEISETGLIGRFAGNTGEAGELSWEVADPQRLEALFSFAVEE
jgi:hypothetical protein